MRVLLIVLAVAGTAEAQLFRRCRSCVRPAVKVVQQVQTPAVLVPVGFVLAPSHFGAPSYPQPAAARQEPSRLDRLEEVISKLASAVNDNRTALLALQGNLGDSGGGAAGIPQLITRHCGKCHTGEMAEGGVRLADFGDKATYALAALEVSEGRMPKLQGENTIPDELRSQLLLALKEMRK